jgi:type II secretory ATPase GspE/PulE/Tfp pilus assembly ATPase PilB-like protein
MSGGKMEWEAPETDSFIVEQVDMLIITAIERGASDIHVEPCRSGLNIRLRVDGIIMQQNSIPREYQLQIVSRIKVLAHINIAEKRIPQDGKITIIHHEKPIDLRVATFPTPLGEKIVIRILDRSHTTIALDDLGLLPIMSEKLKKLITASCGFIIVTGPTGSGKTTTLYSALTALQSQKKHIITLEDPIEYYLDGVTQGQVNPPIGFTFNAGIRAMMRQDPDILMIGEMRDAETAHTAIQAALTGHLVLSTLHTGDTVTAFMRLRDMEIEPFLLNAAITGIVGQRLARRICSACKETYNPSQEELALCQKLGIPSETLSKGMGCSSCFDTGYKGRIGIFELMVVSEAIRDLLHKNTPHAELRSQAIDNGLIPFEYDAREKLRSGILSLEEFVLAIS